jgi:homoserine dehydrogenase
MQEISLALIGFGNVGRALLHLLGRKKDLLEEEYGFTFKVIGIATGHHGMAIDPGGLDLKQALQVDSLDGLSKIEPQANIFDFIRHCGAEYLFENSPVNHETGQPALDYLREGIQQGMHVITANKGPVVHGYEELVKLAASKGVRFMYESTVMDGAPIFSIFRDPLPAVDLHSIQGILNSCTNLIIERMESGESFDQAVQYAQSIGITETDPSEDVDGWDASVKLALLVTILMGVPLKPQEVEREGIRSLIPQMIADALKKGERWKLVCNAVRYGNRVQASVKLKSVSNRSALYAVNGTSSFVQFGMDVLPGLGILESNPGPETTAYGLLADLINVVRRR